MNLVTITGEAEAVRTYKADSGWTRLTANVEGYGPGTVLIGLHPGQVADGVEFEARGRWKRHHKFGPQFEFDVLTVRPPSTVKGVLARLVTYPGIGPKTAEAIVDRFGADTWAMMDGEIDRLREIRGIGCSTLDKIKAHHALQTGPIADVQNRLIELGGRPRMALAIHKVFGDDSLAVLEQHPFRIADKVEGFGFKLADQISRAAGLDCESEERVSAGVMHSLKSAYGEGHCGLPQADLTAAAQKLLGLREEVVAAGVMQLTKRGDLCYRDGVMFARRMDWTEQAVADSIGMLATALHPVWDVGDLPEELSPGQSDAVEAVAMRGLVIMTGGPGTGKSTVVKNVLDVARRAGVQVILCAPTGRAAKRLHETTGHEAKTIHRTLGTIPGTMSFSHDASNPLPPGLVVVDEASMLDVRLAEAFLSALTRDHRLLLVGDADQLPSVGAGNVLRDLIAALDREGSPAPVIRLRQVFRQAEGSTITKNAHRILAGEALEPDPRSRGSAGQFYVLAAADAGEAHRLIVKMASGNIPAAYGLGRLTEVQVLCPMHKGAAGTKSINEALQGIYTRDGEGWGNKFKTFWPGDRVMQCKNDYDRNVFNGDIGTVLAVGVRHADVEGEAMIVEFDGVEVAYGIADLKPLQLAYAMSIHKSQGSEFPAVVIPILREHSIMLRRNLIYTAMTRAQRLCVIVGQRPAIRQAIEAADAARRWTGLEPRVIEAVGLGNRSAALGLG